jgi:hypothetical protein
MPISTVRDILVADGTVAGLVGARVSPLVRSQDEPVPAITLALLAVNPFTTLDDPPNLDSNIVQVNCWAATYDAAQTLSAACRAALETAGLSMRGQSERYEPAVDEYLVALEFLIFT